MRIFNNDVVKLASFNTCSLPGVQFWKLPSFRYYCHDVYCLILPTEYIYVTFTGDPLSTVMSNAEKNMQFTSDNFQQTSHNDDI